MEESVQENLWKKKTSTCASAGETALLAAIRLGWLRRSGSTWHCSAATEDGVILVGGAGIPISRDREIWKFPSPLLPSVCWPAGKRERPLGTQPFLFSSGLSVAVSLSLSSPSF